MSMSITQPTNSCKYEWGRETFVKGMDQLLFMMKILLNKEVNGTEPSPSISIPWGGLFQNIMTW
jgi:hypothetical protein